MKDAPSGRNAEFIQSVAGAPSSAPPCNTRGELQKRLGQAAAATPHKAPRPESVTLVASMHAESFELEFGDRHARIALLGLQTLRSVDAVHGALLESRHYREGLNLIWDLREAELFGLSDWDWALLTSRLARAPVAKHRARMVWMLPRLADDALESKVRRLMSKLKMVDWRLISELEVAVSWASSNE